MNLFGPVDDVEDLGESVEVIPRVVIDVDPALLFGADERDFGLESAAHPLDKILEFDVRKGLLPLLILREDLGRVEVS